MTEVAVKYCGHCNEYLDMKEVLGQIRTRLPDLTYTTVNEVVAPDALLVLNACPAGCASVPPFPPEKIVFVTPDTVDRWSVTPDRLIDEIVSRLTKKLAET